MAEAAELVSQLRASLSHGLAPKEAERVLRSLEDEVLVPHGLYLNGGLARSEAERGLSPEIVGLVARADGRDLTSRDVKWMEIWLSANPVIAEFSVGTLKPANSPEFLR
jgi:hypothetical protein